MHSDGESRWVKRGALLAGCFVLLLAAVVALWTLSRATAGSAEPAGPDPVVMKWPLWPYLTACSGPAFDPVSVFSGRTNAERGRGRTETILRRTIQRWKDYSPSLPKHHWRLLSKGLKIVEYGHGRLPGVEVASIEKSKGRWKFTGYNSECEPTSIVQRREAITWTLSHHQRSLDPNTEQIWIDLGPGECAGGRSQNDRALRPVFYELGNRLLMVMRLRPLPSRPGVIYTCVDVAEPPLQVSLPGPLGPRKLFDGGVYPPTRAKLITR